MIPSILKNVHQINYSFDIDTLERKKTRFGVCIVLFLAASFSLSMVCGQSVPTSLSPTGNAEAGRNPLLTWNLNGNEWVQIWLARTDDLNTPLISDQYGDGVWVNAETSLEIDDVLKTGSSLGPGDYSWFIRGWANGVTGSWSGEQKFTIYSFLSFSGSKWQAKDPSKNHLTDHQRFVSFDADHQIFMPLELPDGATILSVTIAYADHQASQEFRFNVVTVPNPASSSIYNVTAPPSASFTSVTLDLSASNIVVDNRNTSYAMRANDMDSPEVAGSVIVKYIAAD